MFKRRKQNETGCASKNAVLSCVNCFLGEAVHALSKNHANGVKNLWGMFASRFFLIYCPACGGTRAMESILNGDIPSALCYNALAVALVVIIIVFYVVAWIRLARGEERLVVFPKRFWQVCLIPVILFFILRNILLIGFGVDPLGDLIWFWNEI